MFHTQIITFRRQKQLKTCRYLCECRVRFLVYGFFQTFLRTTGTAVYIVLFDHLLQVSKQLHLTQSYDLFDFCFVLTEIH